MGLATSVSHARTRSTPGTLSTSMPRGRSTNCHLGLNQGLVTGVSFFYPFCAIIPDRYIASTPGRIFAFTSDLAKIRPGIDCMLENVPPSLVNRAQEVSLAF